MEREFKIVISIFLFFLIYGLSSFFSTGDFVSPIFLNQIILFIVAVVFYFMNRSIHESWLLIIYIPVILSACAMDVFTMSLLSKITDNPWFVEFQKSIELSWVYLIVFFGFMFFIAVFSFRKHHQILILILNILLLTATVILIFIPESQVDPTIPFFMFIILLFFTSNRILNSESKVLTVLSNHLLLVCFLEGLEYLH